MKTENQNLEQEIQELATLLFKFGVEEDTNAQKSFLHKKYQAENYFRGKSNVYFEISQTLKNILKEQIK